MADWRDVMEARREASDALGQVRQFRGSVTDDGIDADETAADVVIALLLAAEAVCLELRAFSMVTDFVGGVHER